MKWEKSRYKQTGERGNMVKKIIIGIGALAAAGLISMVGYMRKKSKPLYK